MVDQILVDYLRQYKDKFPREALKQKILSKGYSISDYDFALRLAGGTKEVGPVRKESYFPFVRLAGVIGFILLVISFVGLVMPFVNHPINFLPDGAMGWIAEGLLGLVGLGLVIFYFFGFARLARYAHSRLLRFAAVSSIVLTIILGAVVIGGLFYWDILTGIFSQANYSVWQWGLFIFANVLIVFCILVRFSFAISLRDLGDVGFSKLSGIFNLIFASLMFLTYVSTIYLVLNPDLIFSFISSFGSSSAGSSLSAMLVGFIVVLGLIFINLLFESFVLLFASKKFEN